MGNIESGGMEVVPEDAPHSDIVIINTCGFINDAKEESIDTILEYAAAKNRGDIRKLFVMGCLSERYKDELAKELTDVDSIFGVNDMGEILGSLGIDYRKELIGERKLTTPSHFAYFKISEGCDHSCSFCAIPDIRGRHISRSIESLEDEARRLAAKGVKELIVIAQDITYYGIDLYGKKMLAALLEKLVGVDGIEWIRLHYAYPTSFPEMFCTLWHANLKFAAISIFRYSIIPTTFCDP